MWVVCLQYSIKCREILRRGSYPGTSLIQQRLHSNTQRRLDVSVSSREGWKRFFRFRLCRGHESAFFRNGCWGQISIKGVSWTVKRSLWVFRGHVITGVCVRVGSVASLRSVKGGAAAPLWTAGTRVAGGTLHHLNRRRRHRRNQGIRMRQLKHLRFKLGIRYLHTFLKGCDECITGGTKQGRGFIHILYTGRWMTLVVVNKFLDCMNLLH